MGNYELNFYERFLELQTDVRVGKDNYNSFGEYSYRNVEQMMDVVKPIAWKHGILVLFSDRIVNIGDRYYVEATCTCQDTQNPSLSLSATAYAREVLEKKKSDPAQITGMASSYARKYAISAILAIGTGQPDPDSIEHTNEPQEAPQQPVGRDISEFSEAIQRLADVSGVPKKSLIDTFIEQHGNPRHMSDAAYRAAVMQINGEVEKNGGNE